MSLSVCLVEKDETPSGNNHPRLLDVPTLPSILRLLYLHFFGGREMDEFWLWWLCVSAGLFASGFILGKMVKMDNRNGIFPHQLRRHEGAPSQVAREGSKNKAEESSSYSKALVKHLPPLPAGMFVFLSTYGLNSGRSLTLRA